MDALARERLDVDVARGTEFLVFPRLDVQNITFDVQTILLGTEGTPKAQI
jgi:hypothetical protein